MNKSILVLLTIVFCTCQMPKSIDQTMILMEEVDGATKILTYSSGNDSVAEIPIGSLHPVAQSLQVSQSGQYISFLSYSDSVIENSKFTSLVVMNLASRRRTVVTEWNQTWDVDYDWHSESDKLLYVSLEPGEQGVLSYLARTGEKQVVLDLSADDPGYTSVIGPVRYSPTSARIAMVSNLKIEIYNSDTLAMDSTIESGFVEFIEWITDDLLVYSDQSGTYTYEIHSETPVFATELVFPATSQMKNSKILFANDERPRVPDSLVSSDIAMYSFQADTTIYLTSDMTNDIHPVWLRDEQLIAYVRANEKNSQIVTMNLNGTNLREHFVTTREIHSVQSL